MKDVCYLGETIAGGLCRVIVVGGGRARPLPPARPNTTMYHATRKVRGDCWGMVWLSVDLLTHALGNHRAALKAAKDFAVEVIAPIPYERWCIKREHVWDWYLCAEQNTRIVSALGLQQWGVG